MSSKGDDGMLETTPENVKGFRDKWDVYREDEDNPCWKSPDEVIDIQNSNLAQQMELVAKYHPYYKKLFADKGIEAGDIRTLEDLEKLPLTQKLDYMQNAMDFRLAPEQITPRDILYEVTYTTGTTTGKPTPFFNTTHDMFATALQMRRMCEIAWMTPQEVVLNLFPFGVVPHIGFYRTIWYSAAVGMRLVFALTGSGFPEFPVHNSMQKAIEMAENAKATLISGIGSYERRFFMEAQKQGRDFSSIRIVLALGEAVPQGMRDDIRERLADMGAEDVFISNAFGFTEMQGAMPECTQFGGCHNSSPDLYFLEIVDGETGKRKPEGEVGMVAVTHLNRRGTVLLRYLLGDIGAIEYGVCPHCGRSGGRLVIKAGSTYATRTKELIKVKGTLINPEILKNELSNTDGVIEYQIVITKKDPEDPYSLDELMVKIAAAEGHDTGALEKEVVDKVRMAVEMTPKVELVSMADIFDVNTSLKAQRVVDSRPAEN
ncbi:MAG: phenylacetate--CoA ligase family protein [Actinobacteria bacterium]|jgi:phenylacetate-coenzyme A ligase PaaK-like adenylate-forming protein|nr:MAG: phenylacetate--CoA ligase family protein [Actinomycetota bacterium]